MAGQRVFLWTGGQPGSAAGCQQLTDALPLLPPPAPLQRAAHIEYHWGDVKFDIWATACSVRTTAWGSEQMTWLHCKAVQVAQVTPDEPTGAMTGLIPAHYVTAIRPGPTYQLRLSRPSDDLGVFPPNQSTPAGSLPLAEVERTLARLLAVERN